MLDFPNAPTTGQIYTVAPLAWRWDGVKWTAVSTIGPSVPITVTGSTTLPAVTEASVNVNNTSGAAITITLPAASVSDQTYRLKDVAGNASTYPVIVHPTAGTIDGQTDFYMFQDYQAAELYWTGGMWGVR